MVLEATMICVDNSEYQRNGDYTPSRMQAQQDAANLILQIKLRSNPESAVGVLAMAGKVDILSTLTQDNSKLFMHLHKTQPRGDCQFLAGIRVAALALKHRQNRNQRMRIVVFIGSPLGADMNSAELIKLGKKLKKDKINVDVICFGAEANSVDVTKPLNDFVDALNGQSESGESHLVCVPCGVAMPEALLSSAICRSTDGGDNSAAAMAAAAAAGGGAQGGGVDFGFDPNDDPELAMALRVSLEEQRQRQETDARATATQSSDVQQPMDTTSGGSGQPAARTGNFEAMTEDDQLAWALQMSMQEESGSAAGAAQNATPSTTTDVDMAQITDAATLEQMINDMTQDGAEKKDDDTKKKADDKKPKQ